jgi:hypothetical protein
MEKHPTSKPKDENLKDSVLVKNDVKIQDTMTKVSKRSLTFFMALFSSDFKDSIYPENCSCFFAHLIIFSAEQIIYLRVGRKVGMMKWEGCGRSGHG